MFATIASALLLSTASLAPLPGDALASFTIRSTTGQPFTWRPGRLTVISFCAFWCDTWKTQLPRIEATKKATTGLPVDFLTVSVDGRWLDLAKKAPGRILVDEKGTWSSSIKIDRVPYTLVIDPQGSIRWTQYGIVRSENLLHEIRAALKPPESGVVYLAFDDFPWKQNNQEVLALLRSEHVRATFFCIGQNALAQGEWMRKASHDGHSLQMHSWSHDANHPDLPRCVALIQKLTGKKPVFYRPPGSEAILGPDGKKLTIPSVNSYDYQNPEWSELVRRVALSVRPGSVIQMHGCMPNTLKALPSIISNLKKRGYRFESLQPNVMVGKP